MAEETEDDREERKRVELREENKRWASRKRTNRNV